MPRDYLTSLPVELFDYICKLVYVWDRRGPWGNHRQFLGAISKAFLPFARQRLFPTVEAYGEKRALRLLYLLATSPGGAAYVTSLTLVLDEYALSARKIKTSLLSAALTNLVCLETLAVTGAGRFAKMVLSPRKAGLMPSLGVLSVTGEFVGWTDPLAPPFYRHLSRYRQLRDLILDIRSQPRGAAYQAKVVERILMPPSFRLLRLTGQAVDSPTAGVLAASLGAETLSLWSHHKSTKTMSSRLSRLPKTVAHLDLSQRRSMKEDITATLGKCPWLVKLTLWGGLEWSTILRSLGRILPSLVHLELGVSETLSLSDILSILEGPNKIRQLRRLTLRACHRHDYGSLQPPEHFIPVIEVAEREKVELEGVWAVLAGTAKQWRDERLEAEREKEQEKRREISRAAAASAREW